MSLDGISPILLPLDPTPDGELTAKDRQIIWERAKDINDEAFILPLLKDITGHSGEKGVYTYFRGYDFDGDGEVDPTSKFVSLSPPEQRYLVATDLDEENSQRQLRRTGNPDNLDKEGR